MARLRPEWTPEQSWAAFQRKIKVADNGCHHWTGARDRTGYGQLTVEKVHKQAHRHSYEHEFGSVPAGLDLDHVCHNADLTCAGGSSCLHRRCVRPDHLEPATRKVNLNRGRQPNRRDAECGNGHPRTEANTATGVERGLPRRRCRDCTNDAGRRSYHARKAASL